MRQIVPRGFLSTVEATNLIGAHFVPGWTGLERDIVAAFEVRAIRPPYVVTVETTSEDPQGHAARARWLQAREKLVLELASSVSGAEVLEDADGKMTPVHQNVWRSFKASDFLGDNEEGFPIWEHSGSPSAEPIGLRVLIVEEFVTQIVEADSASEKSTEDGQDLEAKNSDNREPRNKPGRPRSKRVLAEGAIRALYPEGGCDGEKLEMLWSLVNEHIAPETVGRETVRRAKEGR